VHRTAFRITDVGELDAAAGVASRELSIDGHVGRPGSRSPKPQVTNAETIERPSVSADDICVNRFSSRDQPGVVLAHPARRAPLQERTPAPAPDASPEAKPLKGPAIVTIHDIRADAGMDSMR
jgi:hypothetical protein